MLCFRIRFTSLHVSQAGLISVHMANMESLGPAAIAGTLFAGLLTTCALVLGYTYLSSTIQWHWQVRNGGNSSNNDAIAPPLLPYVIPGLGSTIAFSNQKVGSFLGKMKVQSQRLGIQAFAIILSGKRTNFIFSPKGISALFASRAVSRDELDQQLGVNSLGMPKEDAAKAFVENMEDKEKTTTAKIHAEYLLNIGAVNQLTTKFMETFQSNLQNEKSLETGVEVDLYSWLWRIIWRTSTTALGGSKLLEMYPGFDVDYRTWEDNLLALLFGVPRFIAPQAYAARDACLVKLEKWLEEGYKHPVEGDPDWEPNFGSRLMRKRHEFAKQQGLSLRAQAGFDLIFIGGIISNATPATGWLLLHIVSPTSPPNFYSSILEELKTCQRSDGSIDIPALTRLPHLNSAFHEMLRLYVDLLVVRQVDSSTALGQHKVCKGEMIMAPTWMTHRNEEYFDRPTEFVPDRFVVMDEKTGKPSYSTAGLNGKYFPFGGGHFM